MRKFSGPRLRRAREDASVSREVAAVTMERSYSTIVAYESGRAVPPPDVAAHLADLYGVDLNSFFELLEEAS